MVEGNYYFPPKDVQTQYFKEDVGYHTQCPWKGNCSYYNVTVGTKSSADGAWFYPVPFTAATEIANYIAFWNGIIVTPL